MCQKGPILLLEERIIENAGCLEECKLRHPKTGMSSTFFFSTSSNIVYEITKFEENYRSWFIKDVILKNGALFIITEINLIYLFLPFLRKHSERFMEIQSILDEEEYPDNKKFEVKFQFVIKTVCDTKEVGNKEFFKYNREKTLDWLKMKVHSLMKVLEELQINTSLSSSLLSSYTKSSKKSTSKEDCTLYACNLISEYLQPELSQELLQIFNLKNETNETVKCITEPPLKKFKTDESFETQDLSSTKVQPVAKKEVLTLAQKKLSKVDRSGMKSITSFFTSPLKQ